MSRSIPKWMSWFGAVALSCSLPLGAMASAASDQSPAPDAGVRNVALGAPYTVTQGYRDDSLMGYENNRSKPGLLTNGKFGAAGTDQDFLDPEWIGYLRQVSREIVIDLGEKKSIDAIKIDFLQHGAVGVDIPRTINYYLSDDNETFYQVGSLKPGIPLTQGGSREPITFDGLQTAARYVKVEVYVGTFAFIDEIEVIGSDTIASNRRPLAGQVQKPAKPLGILKSDDPNSGGTENLFLSYMFQPGQYADDHLSKNTKEDYLRIITHTDENGNPTGRMFDTILFNVGGGKSDYDKQSEWISYLDMAFQQDLNLHALDQAAAEADGVLIDGKKVKVVLPIPFSDPNAKGTWGSIDGQDLTLDIAEIGEQQSYENRVKAVDWYVLEAERRYKEAGFQNLELAGFYWVWEEVGYDSASEENVIKAAADIVHRGNGLGMGNKKFYWIPFYQARGFTFWQELGFDVVMMQPNYFFNQWMGPSPVAGPESDLTRLRHTAELAERFGMGVEMEGDYQLTWKKTSTDYDGQKYNGVQAAQKFYNYMNVYKEYGLDNSVVGWYMGARSSVRDIFTSDMQYLKNLYDDVQLFTQDLYQVKQPDLPAAPVPGQGDSWNQPILVEAKEGDAFISKVDPDESKWLKFPIAAGEDWVVTLTPDSGATVGLETRMWAENQTPHTGFSYLGGQVQSLLVSNSSHQPGAVMLRVFANDGGGGYKITLKKPTEDGTSKMNALRLPLHSSVENTVTAGQEVWYKVSGASAHNLKLVPAAGADMDMEIFWGTNYNNVLAGSYNAAGETETIAYNNPYAPDFVYFVKIKAKTGGSFTLSSD